MTIVVNLFAGPGAGKSTTAAEVFSRLKRAGINAELVTEYAKDLTWENRQPILEDQLYIFAKQNRRVARLLNQVDVVVTDSPIILGLAYTPVGYYNSFAPLVREVWNSYNNVNFFIDRQQRVYNSRGRNQTYEEAILLDLAVKNLLFANEVEYDVVGINSGAAQQVFERIYEKVTNEVYVSDSD